MKTRGTVALAVGAGYLLGRTKKLKLAMTVAGLAGGRRLVGSGGLLSRGFETLKSAPEFEDMRGQVQERLVTAGRTAALATASNAVGRITARVNGAPSLGKSQSGEDDSDEDADNAADDDNGARDEDDNGVRDEAETDEDGGEEDSGDEDGGDEDDVYDEPEDSTDEGDGEDDQADEDRPQKRSGSRKSSPSKRTSSSSSARKSSSKRSKASAGARSGGNDG